ncbi:hypothetical protein SUNI508_01632 [Seiridium unicorne]|uniref:Uncharacterized protein n=1 Tax=Seiridium unicorne TaxID=138068 RepID=A0ABR2UT82_9PEZI
MSSSSPTRTTYSKPYAALSPLRPEVSQAGRTVLITGGNSGIGYAAARAFGQAGASRVIITGRRAEATREAAATLGSRLVNPNTKFVGVTCDMAKADMVERLWADLAAEGTFVDVLVLNATGIAGPGRILERGTEKIWTDYDINVRTQLRMTEYFYKQKSTSATGDKRVGNKFLVMVSTSAIHNYEHTALYPGYGLTKSAATFAMQLIARGTSPDDMQIVNFHPGPVYTNNAKTVGWTEDSFPWHDPNLPGQFAVWAASPEAKFLHGRFVYSAWDVNELKSGELRKKISEDEDFLRIGVVGF